MDFLIEMLDKLLENLNRILGNQEKTLRESPVPSLPSRNQALAIAAKNYAKTDIEIWWPCPVLLDLFILSHYALRPPPPYTPQ